MCEAGMNTTTTYNNSLTIINIIVCDNQAYNT